MRHWQGYKTIPKRVKIKRLVRIGKHLTTKINGLVVEIMATMIHGMLWKPCYYTSHSCCKLTFNLTPKSNLVVSFRSSLEFFGSLGILCFNPWGPEVCCGRGVSCGGGVTFCGRGCCILTGATEKGKNKNMEITQVCPSMNHTNIWFIQLSLCFRLC